MRGNETCGCSETACGSASAVCFIAGSCSITILSPPFAKISSAVMVCEICDISLQS